MSEKQKKDPHPIRPHPRKVLVTPEMAKKMLGHPVTVPMSEREGVFVHGFKCRACQLEFNIYSWKANRHRVDTVGCPECGNRKRFLHWRVTLSESPTMTLDASAEIYKLVPHKGSVVMDDSFLGAM